MPIKISFDSANNIILPTLVLATRKGKKIGSIPAYGIVFKDCLNTYSEFAFNVNKADCNAGLWEQIVDFKLLWVRDWNTWFEINVEVNENDETIKNVSAKSLGESELSQINLYGIEINTEDDIARDDYEPTVLYDGKKPNSSLLTRIMEKAPHYVIKHVDSTIAGIQRTFSFDGTSIYDATLEIAEELDCIFVFDCYSDDNGNIVREVSVYDLESTCLDCGERGEFYIACSKCGSKNIKPGYGEDTTIFASTENLADEITYTTDGGAVKNCFKLEAGDDKMTAAIVNCNPTGSEYIWYISDEVKKDMSAELVAKLEQYNTDYAYYQNVYKTDISGAALTAYNALIKKYKTYTNRFNEITSPVNGYTALMEVYYNTSDFYSYLNEGLMPTVAESSTKAATEAAKLRASNLSPTALKSLDNVSKSNADSAVLTRAKALVDGNYQVKIADSSLSNTTWNGSFTVTANSDSEDTATTGKITVVLSDNYSEYVRQLLETSLRNSAKNYNIAGMAEFFALGDTAFSAELKKYSLSGLNAFYESCQSCIDILIDQGTGDDQLWENSIPNLYKTYYVPYHNKLHLIDTEMNLRKNEIAVIVGTYDAKGNLIADGLQTVINSKRNVIHNFLDFESYLDKDLRLEFSAYRREDTYKNDNYISDGLDNAELFNRAVEFIALAEKEIYKSATLQHSISASLKNLLVMKEFAPIVDYFAVGNWIRIRIDNNIYRLRLLDYEIDFDSLDNISITFSDVAMTNSGANDIRSVLNQASSMATSYGSTMRQAKQGADSKGVLDNWVQRGLDATNVKIMSNADNQNQTWDSHGMLFRAYDPITDSYDDCQLKIINSTLAVTDDNWETIKTAVGGFYYFDPVTDKLTYAYGINAEVLIGKLILGESLGIYSDNNSLTFDRNGLVITNGINTFNVNPNSNNLLVLSNDKGDVLWVDNKGGLHITGDGAGLDISANDTINNLSTRITQNAESITLEANRAKQSETQIDGRITTVNETLSSKIEQTAESITLNVNSVMNKYDTTGYTISLYGYTAAASSGYKASDYNGKYYLNQTNGYLYKSNGTSWVYTARLTMVTDNLSSRITQTANDITSEVSRATTAEGNLSTRITQNANSISSKVSTNEFSTLIQQNAYSVRIAWNNISNYVEFSGGALNIYSSSTRGSDTLLMQMNYSGAWYYRDGYTVGRIGTNQWSGNSSHKGLVFDLESTGKYMCWAQRATANADSYTTVLTYSRANSIYTEEGIHFGCPTYSNGWLYTSANVKLAAYENGDGGLSSEDGNIILSSGDTMLVCSQDTISAYNDLDLNNFSVLNQSDARLKTNIEKTDVNALELINQIQLMKFDWIEDNSHENIGIIAQQLMTCAPELVHEDEKTGKLSIKENKFIPYLIKAIQELYARDNASKTSAVAHTLSSNSKALVEENTNSTWADEYTMEEKEQFVNSVAGFKPNRKNEYVEKPITFQM